VPQLLGRIRPTIVAIIGLLFTFDLQNDSPALPFDQWVIGTTGLLALLSVAQIIFRKQPHPVWTKKAILLCFTALLLTALASFALTLQGNTAQPLPLFPLVPLLQPVFLVITWALFLPVDHFLKNRILAHARAVRARFPDLPVIGVTGSVGKTTTKELLHHILQDLRPLTTPAHVNAEIGVAQWMIRELGKASPTAPPGLLIVEMGAYRRGEISVLSSIAKQTIGVLTFIGKQHIALFGSREALIAAKAEILTTLPKTGHAFLNADNDACASLKDITPCPVTLVGTGAGVDLLATDSEETPGGIRFVAGHTTFDVPLHGTHNVTNVLLAIAVGQHLGLSLQAIAAKLRTFSAPKQTFEVREERGVRILDDTHNSSAESFRAAIDWARSQPYEEKVLLTSGIIELGEEEERLHGELGAHCASVFQRAVFTQERSMTAFARGFGKPVELIQVGAERPVHANALLVCVGKMSPALVRRLLPSS